MIDKQFWQGKRVYLTGHTGFKGGWMSLWLSSMGANVKGYALEPPTHPSLFEVASVAKAVESEFGDIRDREKLMLSMNRFKPDIVIHMAAQPLVRASYVDPVETYETNVMGTVNVFEAARRCTNLKCIVNITTDKCYENKEWVWGYREDEPMGGYDPYSSSKGCAELITSSYRRSFFTQLSVGLASVRAGNVIGGGDWADDRLIPDILRAFEKGDAVLIRNPEAVRPWQHVLEPLSGYLKLAQELFVSPEQFAEAWNFGPSESDTRSVGWIVEKMAAHWPGANWNLDSSVSPHEAGYLKLDISKVRRRLGWNPVWKLDQTLPRIVNWHRNWLGKNDMQKICLNEINEYMSEMNNAAA